MMFYCPKCGTTIEEGKTVCPNCGLDVTKVNPIIKNAASSADSRAASDVKKVKRYGNSAVKYAYFVLAAVVLIMFFVAAARIAYSGNEIHQIESVGGETLEEAYYFELGSIYAGYAMISRALGIFFSSVLVWLGLKK